MNNKQHRLVISLEAYKKEWKYNSFLLHGQVSELMKVQNELRINWMNEIIQQHIEFIIQYDKSTVAFASSFIKLYDLQQFQLFALEDIVTAYAKSDVKLFEAMLEKITSTAKDKHNG